MSQLTGYRIDASHLPPELRDLVVEFSPDKELEAFLEDCRRRPHTFLDFLRLDFLSLFMSDYEAHGVLGMYPMHLLSSAQWETLIPPRLRGGKLLDVGAGQGFVTEHARPLFSQIYATETSRSMAKRLEARGFITKAEDVAVNPSLFAEEEFDFISILNVLDRCAKPLTLLRNCIRFLKDDGLIVISDPLPLQQRVRNAFSKPKEKIATRESGVWETDFVDFYKTVLKPSGLIPVRISRLPYLYKSTKENPFVALDDFLVVCKKS